jgi:diguanylate cyclase (GGDEF)-like protein
MLMPSLKGMVLHDGFGEVLWASDEWDLDDKPRSGEGRDRQRHHDPAEFPGVVRIDADRALYSFAVRSEQVELLGVVTLQTRLSGARTEARPLPYVRQILQPALECLRRELSLRAQLGSRERDLGVRERDLSLMLEMSSNQTATGDADEFDLILKTALEHMGCALAALWVPDKNIGMSMTRSGHPMSEESLQRANSTSWPGSSCSSARSSSITSRKWRARAPRPFKILACPVRHPSERVMGVLALFNPASAHDFDSYQTRVAELLAKKVTVIIQAQYDASTGLMTRHAFERQAASLLGSAGEPEQHCILYLDIDRLHVINETFGMHVGDDVIASVAECMARCVVPPALSARISGDRLAALIPNAGIAAATAIAERIPRRGRGHRAARRSGIVRGVGVHRRRARGALRERARACAGDGGDRMQGRQGPRPQPGRGLPGLRPEHHPPPHRHPHRRQAARRAGPRQLPARCPAHPAAARQLRTAALRAVDPHAGRARRGDPSRQIPFRGRALPAHADRRPLGRESLPAKLLSAHAAAVGEDIARFAINLSGQSLQDETFLPFVVDTIKNSGLSPNVLCFELTETATVGNLERAQSFLRALQDLGCQFALDDFGTGVSSLAYLKDLSVNYLKIDGSFVRDSITNTRSESMIKAIAQLAKVMCIETVAEYVETDMRCGRAWPIWASITGRDSPWASTSRSSNCSKSSPCSRRP